MTTALLVIDMQNQFLSMTSTCLPNIINLINHIQNSFLPVLFTQHGHTPAELTPPFKNQLVRKWGPSGSIAVNTTGWKLLPKIQALTNGYPIVAKNTYDAFINTNLSEILESHGVRKVVVCGVMTDCCCDTTARSSFNRGFETIMVGDACGTASKRQHDAGLGGFAFAFGEVLTTEEVIKELEI